MFLSDCIVHQYSSFPIIISKLELMLLLFSFLGTVRIEDIESQVIGKKLALKCIIPTFTNTATWSKDGNPLTTCNIAICSPDKYENVTTFSFGNNYIEVTFDTVESSIFGEWTCTHASGSDSFNVTGSKCFIKYILNFLYCTVICILQHPKFVSTTSSSSIAVCIICGM